MLEWKPAASDPDGRFTLTAGPVPQHQRTVPLAAFGVAALGLPGLVAIWREGQLEHDPFVFAFLGLFAAALTLFGGVMILWVAFALGGRVTCYRALEHLVLERRIGRLPLGWPRRYRIRDLGRLRIERREREHRGGVYSTAEIAVDYQGRPVTLFSALSYEEAVRVIDGPLARLLSPPEPSALDPGVSMA